MISCSHWGMFEYPPIHAVNEVRDSVTFYPRGITWIDKDYKHWNVDPTEMFPTYQRLNFGPDLP